MIAPFPGWLLIVPFLVLALPAHGQPQPAVSPAPAAQPAGTPAAAAEPKPELERPTIWGEPTEVQIFLYVIDIDEVNMAKQSFSASIYLESRWNIPALRHVGPGPLHRAWTEVWTPRLAIVNSQEAWRAFPESVEILPNGDVIYRQKIWGQFSQPLDLRAFPQDVQKLAIHVAAVGLPESEVRMVPLERFKDRKFGIAERFSLPDYDVVSWKAGSMPYQAVRGETGTAGYLMEIEIGRQMTYYVIKVIIPLCLILIMSWLPRWIDPREIGTNFGISATAFLTLIAYLFSITVLLPRVSYITYLDRFILLSTFVVFMGLLHTLLSTMLVKREKLELAMRVDRWARFALPAILILVLALSFKL